MGQKVTLVSAASAPVRSTASRHRDRGRFVSGEVRSAALDRILVDTTAPSATETVGTDGEFQSCL